MNTPIQNSSQEHSSEGVFYCQLESHQATKDYLRHGRCVRFFGVRPQHFSKSAFERGVSTFTIDIDYWDFCVNALGANHAGLLRRAQCEEIDRRDENPEYRNAWYRVEVEFCERASGYLYPTFSEEDERYFRLIRIQPIPPTPEVSMFCAQPEPSANTVPQFLASVIPSEPVSPLSNNHFLFESFHVGQGMCSLVHNGHRGVLL